MYLTAEQIAQRHHIESNPLAMSELTFSPSEEGLLAVIDNLIRRMDRQEALSGRLNKSSHPE